MRTLHTISHNEQGFMQGWKSGNVRPAFADSLIEKLKTRLARLPALHKTPCYRFGTGEKLVTSKLKDMNAEKIVMYESPEAATYVTNIEGWIDINRRFFGKGEDGERMARYSSHTHKVCECGGKIEKGYTKCPECRHKSAVERYNALQFKEWDGKEPVCTWDGDKYFFNEDDLIEHMTDDEDEPMSEIDLLICDPVNFRQIDLETVADDTHEDWEPEKELCDKIDEFNAYLKTLHPHSWMPSKVRTHYKLHTGSADR